MTFLSWLLMSLALRSASCKSRDLSSSAPLSVFSSVSHCPCTREGGWVVEKESGSEREREKMQRKREMEKMRGDRGVGGGA